MPAAAAAAGAVGAQHGGGGVDGVGRVVDAQRPVWAGGVLGEGGGQELHRPFGPGEVVPGVHAGRAGLAVTGLDGADAREH